MRGIMVDVSRNAVMNISELKKFVLVMERLNYDTLMLYTEDTYEVDGEPLFGHFRGRYSKAELTEIDTFCSEHGIELVPCIQTLAHLNAIFKWSEYAHKVLDCDDILLAEDDNTYELIDHMFASLSSCIKSRKIHIGMDEAYNVGLGRYLRIHGMQNRFDIINRHLHKVCEIADKYGYKPMIWSDMFCKLVSGSTDYYSGADMEKIKTMAALPENITLVYWDYYSTDYNRYVKMIETNKAFDRPVAFAGGAWTWNGFAPANKFSIATTTQALKACKDCGIDNVFLTMWGDDGAECSRFAVLPALVYSAGLLDGKSEEEIKKDFYDITGMSYDEFILLDLLDGPIDGIKDPYTKILFYNDPFMGMFDHKVRSIENKYYRDLYEKLSAINVSEDYKNMFDYAKALADFLSVKSELGVKTRTAYKNRNISELRKIAENDYTAAIEKLTAFYDIYQHFWLGENKPHGFDIQDLRMGGLTKRLSSCQKRLISYCNGDTDNIPELEEDVLQSSPTSVHWAKMVSPNVITHGF